MTLYKTNPFLYMVLIIRTFLSLSGISEVNPTTLL